MSTVFSKVKITFDGEVVFDFDVERDEVKEDE